MYIIGYDQHLYILTLLKVEWKVLFNPDAHENCTTTCTNDWKQHLGPPLFILDVYQNNDHNQLNDTMESGKYFSKKSSSSQ